MRNNMFPLRNDSRGNVERHGNYGLVSGVQGQSLLGHCLGLMSASVKVSVTFIHVLGNFPTARCSAVDDRILRRAGELHRAKIRARHECQ